MVKVPDDVQTNPMHDDEISGPDGAAARKSRRERVHLQMIQKDIVDSLAKPYNELVKTVKLCTRKGPAS